MTEKQNEKGSGSNDALGSINDPFFIPHSDSPTAVLVSPLLSGDNYGTWLRAMTMALRAKNKLGFVDGTIEIPKEANMLRQWERCNDLVSSWILNSTETAIRGSILYAETAREVWLDLHDRFTQTNASKVYQLKQAIGKTTQEDTSVSSYFTRMKALWDELSSLSTVQPCTCGHGKANAALHQQDRAMEFLQGLHEHYSNLRSQILLMEPFPSAAKIYALVRQEEKQQEIHSSTPSTTMPEAAALIVNSVTTNGTENQSTLPKIMLISAPIPGVRVITRTDHPIDKPRGSSNNHRLSSSSSSGAPRSNDRAMVAAPLITQDQYNNILAMLSSGSINSQANLAGTPTIDIWHWRLGHPSHHRLSELAKNVPSISCSNKYVCDVCPQAKQTKLSFPTSSISSNNPFQLIHVDIWGSFSQQSMSGARYFLTIVDDFSRCTWVYLMRFKSDTSYHLKSFFSMVKTQFQGKITHVFSGDGDLFLPQIQQDRFDNGSEFLSNKMQHFFSENGVIHQRSCVSTPQQNGVVERKHRHLLEVARALRFQANLPLSFWGECILTATYLINKTPTLLLQNRSPHEVLFCKQPSYSTLRVFGCLVFAHNANIKHKFDQRAKPGIFVGYPYAQKGYRIYDIKSKTIYVSRDVVFHETIFPFHDVTPTPTPTPVISLPIEDHPRYDYYSPSSTIASPMPNSSPSASESSLVPRECPPIVQTYHRRKSVPIIPQEVQSNPPTPVPQVETVDNMNPAPTKHSTRERKQPAYLQDYHCSRVIHAALPTSSASKSADDFTFNGCLKLDGRAELGSNGLFTLNESAEGTIGHAFYSFPIQFKKSLNASVISFSTTFIFAIVSADRNYRGDGLASSNNVPDDFTFNGCLKVEGRAELGSNGLFTLNGSAEGTIGHAFYSFPIQFKKSSNASVISFSTTFIFAIVPANGNYRGDGLAPPPPLPDLCLSGEVVNEIAGFIHSCINALLSTSKDIALGKDTRMFFRVAAYLCVLSVAGGFTDFLTLGYTSLLVVLTIPALYEKYEDDIDRYILMGCRELQQLCMNLMQSISVGFESGFSTSRSRN
ncbi:hypothetical protein RHSIM_RhsimUnG0185000 [Rhododendron simsii]|uniref:Reticulon-like protein n=1 Tax=Rhododendron simsii TaxID=118357 RepID=A0A834FTQ8_RHOSS|nr:hypothetical protein RHSIM_RhsimUnG0185000 [Rhododendron simsii]